MTTRVTTTTTTARQTVHSAAVQQAQVYYMGPISFRTYINTFAIFFLLLFIYLSILSHLLLINENGTERS
jgi:hypothetical protein